MAPLLYFVFCHRISSADARSSSNLEGKFPEHIAFLPLKSAVREEAQIPNMAYGGN